MCTVVFAFDPSQFELCAPIAALALASLARCGVLATFLSLKNGLARHKPVKSG